jgi:hypothetical protein
MQRTIADALIAFDDSGYEASQLISEDERVRASNFRRRILDALPGALYKEVSAAYTTRDKRRGAK